LNLIDADFVAVSKCQKLGHIYLSFNFIPVDAIARIVGDKPCLTSLEIYGIRLTLPDCYGILLSCYKTLLFIYLSLAPQVEEDDFYRMIHTHYIDLNVNVYKIDFES